MASSLKCFACFFIISLLSVQIHARESQFFSKVSATTTATPTTTTTTTTVNNKDGLKNNEQDPSFIPETQNGYGLYGQKSTQYPTTTQLAGSDTYTTTPPTNLPYKTQETYSSNNNENYYYNPNDNEFSNVNQYEYQQQNMGETRLQDTSYTPATENQNNNNNNYYYNGGSGYNNVEKQGMSDTRFMEGGKYYYDLSNENNKYYANDQYQNTKANYENTRGGFYSNNNNENYFYNNNNNENSNMENFQNEQYDP